MAVTSGFFNSLNHDRRYDADQMGSIFDGIILDGVYLNIGDAFEVTAGPGDMQVTVGTGRAWFMHTWTLNDSAVVFNVTEASLASSRIDAVVIDVDKRRTKRANTIKYLSGLPDKDGTSLISEEDHKQYPICYIDVAAGVTKITQSAITYTCGSSQTPFVTGVLQMLNLDNVTNQFNSVFYEWFEGIKDALDENTAGKLYNQIVSLQSKVNANSSQISRLVREVFDPSNGQNLGTTLTAQQKAAIQSGTFDGIFPGDYWVINGVKWYVIDYDYYMRYTPHDGTPACTNHHLVVIPEKIFWATGTVDIDMPIANKLSHETDSPYSIDVSALSIINSAIEQRTYYMNVPLVTSTGFDFQNPGTDAVAFAQAAWGDNLVAVPDVFGTAESMYQDFEWKTVENGILIPHFLDMDHLAQKSYDGTYTFYTQPFLKTTPGTLTTSSSGVELPTLRNQFRYPTNPDRSDTIYQNGTVLPLNNLSPTTYTQVESECRKFLAARFPVNGRYLVQPSQLPNSLKDIFVTVGNAGVFLKDCIQYDTQAPRTDVTDYSYNNHTYSLDGIFFLYHDLNAFKQAFITAGGSEYHFDYMHVSTTTWPDDYPEGNTSYDSFMRYVRGNTFSQQCIVCGIHAPGIGSTDHFHHVVYKDAEKNPIPREDRDSMNVSSDVDVTMLTKNPYYLSLQMDSTSSGSTEGLTGYYSGCQMYNPLLYPIVCCIG